MEFRLYPLRFSFVALDEVRFPAGKSANLLRGAFGSILRRITCRPDCDSARECEIRSSCAYARMFEPSALGRGPSGLADWPRPFVFRAMHLDGLTIPAGQTFFFDLNLFDMRNAATPNLVSAFAELAREGLGPGRGRAKLIEADEPQPLTLSLDPVDDRVESVRVQFVTPTELKSGHLLAEQPEFGVLACRIRDRLSTLRELYDDGPLNLDFRNFGERASDIRMTRCEIRHIDAVRRSSRTGQVHSIGGFVGEADYEGNLSEFLPYLRAAKWTGVGRQTVWGKGVIEVHCR